ncbi:MAG: hypothetical protein DHS20C09_06570 [marine bacterium B5-7]|nr:MAG: hypothetical protein DHS20C09_06570 [marine bacterium B5-7]
MSANIKFVSLTILVLSMISGCEPHRTSGSGLFLPKGDIENGKQAFIDLNCHQCHTITDVELPRFALETPLINIELGGKVHRVKSYGELITAITNPDHVISNKHLLQLSESAQNSPMPSLNDDMSVTQLIDLITLLNSQYTRLIREYKHEINY